MVKIRFFITISILFLNSIPSNSQDLNNWIGNYHYEEKPVKALAGYYMGMIWDLVINKDTENYYATIEINGQQTYMIVKAIAVGDNTKINLKFDKGLKGFGF